MELALTAIGCFLFALCFINAATGFSVYKLCSLISAELKR